MRFTLARDVELCWIYPGDLSHHDNSVFVIEYVHRWEIAESLNAESDCRIAQVTLQFVLQREKITHWIEPGRESEQCHKSLLTTGYCA